MSAPFGVVWPVNRSLACVRPTGAKVTARERRAMREAFGAFQAGDVGKRVYLRDGIFQMENDAQRDERKATEHNPDLNPAWSPLVAWRVYACDVCEGERQSQTNHTGKIYATRCMGTCRDIAHPHTARERVSPAFTTHHFIRGAQ